MIGKIVLISIFFCFSLFAENNNSEEEKDNDLSPGELFISFTHGNGLPAEGVSPGFSAGFFFWKNSAVIFDYSYIKALRYPEFMNWEMEGEFIDLSVIRTIPFHSLGYIHGGVGVGFVNINIYPENCKPVKKRYFEAFVEGGFEVFIFTEYVSAGMTVRQRWMGMIDRGSEPISENDSDSVKNFDVSTYTMSAFFNISLRYNIFDFFRKNRGGKDA
ncbi:MAG: hypothetical protein R6W70_07640 [bacterium]